MPPSNYDVMRTKAYACVAAAVALLGAAMLPAHAARSAPKAVLGPNLLPNPGFESSVIEPSPVPQYATSQPLMPTGWVVEGATGLFDHGQHTAHSGKRAITISDPASTPRNFCQKSTCVDDPADTPRASLEQYYSETPTWRTQSAIPVTAGKTYQLSVWVSWSLETVSYGAVTAVRWVDGNGVPVAISAGPQLLATGRSSPALAYTQIAGTVTAPKGAVGAIVMLGDSDDVWISSLSYDDAYFGTYTPAAPRPAKKKHR